MPRLLPLCATGKEGDDNDDDDDDDPRPSIADKAVIIVSRDGVFEEYPDLADEEEDAGEDGVRYDDKGE